MRIELEGRMDAWPTNVRVGGKVHAVIFASGSDSGLIALLARSLQRLRSWASYLR